MDDKKKAINKKIDELFDEIQYEEPDTEPRRQDEDVLEPADAEAVEVGTNAVEEEGSETEAQETDLNLTEDDEPALSVDSDENPPEDAESENDISPDDLLDDVRQSLILDTTEKEEAEQSKWWKRIGRRSKKKKEEDTAPSESESLTVEETPIEEIEQQEEETEQQEDEQEEYVEQLDELIDMLADTVDEPVEEEMSVPPAAAVDESVVEEEEKVEEKVDFTELKKRAFSARVTPEEEERSLSEVRSVALDEGEEVFVEVEAQAEDPMRDRMKAMENALLPYRRYLNLIFIFVSVVMVVIVSASLFRLYQRSLPPPPTEAVDVALLPYPVEMDLPGELKFPLGKGQLDNTGRWNPVRAEWLEGTEICRWIAIPWSRQLEAVVRTLTREDQITLIMSNNDELKYTVTSIDQMSIDEMQKLDSNTPCMLLVLARSDAETRWVVTAVP